MRLEVAVFRGSVRLSEEGNLPGVEVRFTPRGDVAPSSAFSCGISARASGPSGNGSSWRRRQRRAPGPHSPARQIRSLWTVSQATLGSCLHSPTARTRPQRPLGRPVGPQARWREGWREFEKFPGGPGFPPTPTPEGASAWGSRESWRKRRKAAEGQ